MVVTRGWLHFLTASPPQFHETDDQCPLGCLVLAAVVAYSSAMVAVSSYHSFHFDGLDLTVE